MTGPRHLNGVTVNREQDSRTGEVTRLIERWLDLQENGRTLPVTELCKDQPHLQEDVERELNAIRKMDGLLESTSGDNSKVDQAGDRLGKRTGIAQSTSSYQIQRMHAYGGCSEVYIAEDRQLGRTVAVKFLRPDVEENESYRLRLEREAEITSRLDHPGVVSIHSRGEDDHGMPFYTMRFVEGRSLREEIDKLHEQPVVDVRDASFRKLLGHFVDACQTIAFAHSRGVIHRDLKPDNIVTGNFGETYVIDWGLARHSSTAEQIGGAVAGKQDGPRGASLTSAGNADLTTVGNIIGTPAFMSPEQARGERADKASDVFCLGATLYMVLTGVAPYKSDSLIDVLNHAKGCAFQSPRDVNPVIPRKLDAICRKAMSADAADRYANPAMLAADVENFFADLPVDAYPDRLADRLGRWLRRNRTYVTAAVSTGLVGILILGVAAIYLIDANRSLMQSEAEATFQKNETARALETAQERLYSQRIALAHSELQKNNVERAAEILEQCPASQRQWEWYHLRWLIKRHSPLAVLRPGISAFDPSGSRLLIADPLGEIFIYDTESWLVEETWKIEGTITDLAFSPDGERVAVVGMYPYEGSRRGVVRILDGNNGEEKCLRRGHGSLATCLSWSEDGSLLITGGTGGRIRIRDSSTLEPAVRIDEPRGAVTGVTFVEDGNGQFSACFENGDLVVWDEEGSITSSHRAHKERASGISSGNGVMVTCGNDRLVRIWSSTVDDTALSADVLVGHRDFVEAVSCSPDGNAVASVGLDRSVRLWDLETSEQIAEINRHTSHVRHVEFDCQGRLFTTSGDDRTTFVWQTEELTQRLPAGEFVCFSGDGTSLVSATRDGFYIRDVVNRKNVARNESLTSDIFGLCSSPDGTRFATVHDDGQVNVWNCSDGSPVNSMERGGAAAFSACFTDNDTIVTGYRDATIRFHDVSSGEEVGRIDTGNAVLRIELDAGSDRAVAGLSNGDVAVVDLVSMQILRRFAAHEGQVLDIAVSPDGQTIATTATDGNISLWDIETCDRLQISHVGVSWLNCIEFTPDGRRLVSGSEHTVAFWDAESLEEILSMSTDRCVHTMAFSIDGSLMAVGGEDPRIRIWEGGVRTR